jgi:hypothetical protein
MNARRLLAPFSLAIALFTQRASADVGDGGDAGDAAVEDAAAGATSGDDGGPASAETPLACGGALCDTSNQSACDVAGGAGRGGSLLFASAIVAACAAALRRRRRAVSAAAAAVVVTAASGAHAVEPGVDVRIVDRPPPNRRVAIEWNPLPLTIGRASANVVLVPVDHHALVVSPFYAWSKTEAINVQDASGNAVRNLPEQRFDGFGAELGYRWYSGLAGPRGFFVGPSLVLGKFTAKAQDGSETPYMQLGAAADIGYQAIVADCVSLSLGAGVQYTAPSKSIPDQQFPADLYANALVRPRVLASIGWAF